MTGSVLILHGYTGDPDGHWLPWLHRQLTERGFIVSRPALPDPDEPKREQWLSIVEDFVQAASEPIVLVGHSLGATTILRYLEKKPIKPIRAAMLVAAPTDPSIQSNRHPGILGFLEPDPLDFQAIQTNVERIEAFYSADDDAVAVTEGERLREAAHATWHFFQDKGHFCARDGVTEFPELLECILAAASHR